MIKSTSSLLDATKYKHLKPQAAEGRVKIELKDPITGKVIDVTEGKNYVFPDSLFTGSNGDWVGSISGAHLVLTDSLHPIDPDMPFILGKTIGYGVPSTAGAGLYRGAYNAQNQQLAVADLTRIRWKFQYDFTAAQALGTIGTIGLTHQFAGGGKISARFFKPPSTFANIHTYPCDGRYSYGWTSQAKLIKYDNLLGVSETIDVSSVLGSSGPGYSSNCHVGYNPVSKKFYIYCSNGITGISGKLLIEFSDNTFTTVTNMYSISNFNPSIAAYYVYGNKIYVTTNNIIYIFDYVNDTVVDMLDLRSYIPPSEFSGASYNLGVGTFADGKYLYVSGYYYYYSGSSNNYIGVIFDMENDEILGYQIGGSQAPYVKDPFSENFLPVSVTSNGFANKSAIAAKLLSEPKVKTAEDPKGMTATYELEVFW